MTTFFEFVVIAVPLTAAVGALLFFGRKRIHRQMAEIAEAAESGAFKRPVRFRPVRTLPQNLQPFGSGCHAATVVATQNPATLETK